METYFTVDTIRVLQYVQFPSNVFETTGFVRIVHRIYILLFPVFTHHENNSSGLNRIYFEILFLSFSY